MLDAEGIVVDRSHTIIVDFLEVLSLDLEVVIELSSFLVLHIENALCEVLVLNHIFLFWKLDPVDFLLLTILTLERVAVLDIDGDAEPEEDDALSNHGSPRDPELWIIVIHLSITSILLDQDHSE